MALALNPETPDLTTALDAAQSEYDDRIWSRHIFQPFTWQRFIDWWAARKYVVPRDIRKR